VWFVRGPRPAGVTVTSSVRVGAGVIPAMRIWAICAGTQSCARRRRRESPLRPPEPHLLAPALSHLTWSLMVVCYLPPMFWAGEDTSLAAAGGAGGAAVWASRRR
jgi:hypothetical protein